MTIPDFVARLQTEVLRANRPGKKHGLDGILTERLRRTAKHEESYVGADSDAKKAEFLRSPTMSATPLPPGKEERCQGPEMSTQWRPPTSPTRRQEKQETDNLAIPMSSMRHRPACRPLAQPNCGPDGLPNRTLLT